MLDLMQQINDDLISISIQQFKRKAGQETCFCPIAICAYPGGVLVLPPINRYQRRFRYQQYPGWNIIASAFSLTIEECIQQAG
jgi:hypothetical protein